MNSILFGRSVKYGIDKVEFVSKKDISFFDKMVRKIRPFGMKYGMLNLKKISTTTNDKLNYKNKSLVSNGYRTIVIITRITELTFPYLIENNINFDYLSLVELFRDIECKDNDEAISLTKKIIRKSYLLYQDSHAHLFVRSDLRTHRIKHGPFLTEKRYYDHFYGLYRKQNKKTTIGERTLYLGGHDFTHVTYARNSKTTDAPVVHQEFRLAGRNIARLAKVKKGKTNYLGSLKSLQSSSVADIYEYLDKTHVKLADINQLKLANNHLELSRRKKLSVEEVCDSKLYLKHLKSAHPLNITSYFMKYFRKSKANYSLFLLPESLGSLL